MKVSTFPLGDIATIERDALSPEAIESGTLYVGLENVVNDGSFLNVRRVEIGELASAKFRFSESHILFGKLRPYLRKIARPNFEGICSTDILPILPGAKIDRAYLYHYLRTPEVIDLATTRSSGANLPRISPNTLAEFEIPLPPLGEQRRIAEVLDRADVLRQKRRLAIQKLDTLLQSVFLDMFGDPKSNPKQWRQLETGQVLDDERFGVRSGPFGSSLKKHEYTVEGVPVWGINNVMPNRFVENDSLHITEEKFNQLLNYKVESGDVLISRAGTVGRMCVAEPSTSDSIIGTNLVRVALNKSVISPLFFSSMFTFFGERLGSLKTSGDKDSYSFLNPKILLTVKIPLPPIDLQLKFELIFRGLVSASESHDEYLAKSNSLFNSLQHRAFRGELFSE